MRTNRRFIYLTLLLVAAVAGLGPGTASAYLAGPAVGTPSGTLIGNQANLNFSVGGAAQTVISAQSPTVAVDNKINVVVSAVDSAAVSVVPGQSSAYLTFTVSNQGNTVQDYHLSYIQRAGGAGKFGSTDNFNAGNVAIFVKNGPGSTYVPGSDIATYIDELGSGSTATVFIVVDISPAQVNNDVASFDLIAQTAQGGTAGSLGADITTDDKNTPKSTDWLHVYSVFIDAAGSASGEGAKDGKHSAQDDFKVITAVLSVNKTVTVIWDPVNANSGPREIPGSAMQYAIGISNAATAGKSATLTTISDVLNANLAFDPDLRTAGTSTTYTSLTRESAVGNGFGVTYSNARNTTWPKYFTTADDAPDDGIHYSGGAVSADFSKILPGTGSWTAGELKTGETVTIYFNVLVQ